MEQEKSGSITYRISILNDEPNLDTFKYEAYGASPSTGFPAKIHCLGDDKQLFNKDTAVHGYVSDVSGNSISDATKYRSDYMEVEQNENYYITEQDNTNWGAWYDKDKNFISGISSYGLVIAPSNAKYMRITIKNDDCLNIMKVCKSTVATPWSPYMHGTVVNKSRNKNLASTEIIKSLNKPVFTNITSNGFALDVSQGIVSGLNLIDIMFGELDGSEQYTLSYHLSQNNTTFNPRLAFYYTDGTTSLPPVNSNSEVDVSFSSVVGKTIERISLIWSTASTGSLAEFSKIQLEEGDKSDYVPHKEDTQTTYLKEPLYGIGEVQDELDLTNKQIIRRLGKKVFDGTENIVTNGTTKQGLFRYDLIINTMKANAKAISSHFKTILLTNVDELSEACISTHGSESKVIFWTNFTTLTDFKAFLAEQYANGTPVEIIYELATPIIESINCSDKIKQYDGQTTVYNVDGAELECTLTNNRAIAEVNENLHRIEGQINEIEQNTKLENMNKNIRGHFEFIENSDANKLTKVGLYRLTGTLTNYPSTSGGILEVNGSEDIAIEQIFTQHNGKKWNRICWYGTWSSWLTMN